MNDDLSVPREDLQILFDTAVNSMDFGSGFLDDHEVECLRRIAVVLGADPKVATPYEFQSKYPHPFDRQEYETHKGGEWFTVIMCRRCGKPEENAMHNYTLGDQA